MRSNRFREVVAEGRVPVGHMIMEFGTRGIAKILEASDVDFVVFDMEHSGFDVERVFDLLAWSKACSFAPMVRVPQVQYHFLARVMDAGAMGVMAANVETAEEAREVVAAVKYAPAGRRGVGLGTAHNDYVMPSDPSRYFEESNASTVVICQIESELGVSNAASIAGTPGVDCLWVGHFDLSACLGIPAQFGHERFRSAMHQVVEAARAHGKLLGVQPPNSALAAEWRAMGFNVMSWGSDISIYRAALHAGVKALR